MPTADKDRNTVTVSQFLESAAMLQLELVAENRGMDNVIGEEAINRPGLALTGFFQHFANRRIQVLGLADNAYLASLGEAERHERLDRFFSAKIPCVVLTRNRKVPKEMLELAAKQKVPVFRTPMITKNFINAATIIMENLMAPSRTVIGSMVEILGIGVLIEGRPGIGKSEAALGLIHKGYSLVSDDITACRLDSSDHVVCSAIGATRYHMEIRGLGIVHVPSLFGVASVRAEKRLDLIVTLSDDLKRFEEDRSGQERRTKEVLGVPIPHVYVPVAAGRDLAIAVETAALDQKLKVLGHDAAKEIDEKLIEMMTKGQNASE